VAHKVYFMALIGQYQSMTRVSIRQYRAR